MKFSWKDLKKPIFILAPMEDVTDTVFRQIVGHCGKPDLYFTEFTNTDALFSPGEKNAMQRLLFTENERPLIAQIWGIHPENFYKASLRISDLGFDGIDINMGCPEKSVVKQGACSALIKNHALAKEIIHAVKSGAKNLQVSVKTRIGYNTIDISSWIGFLLEQNLDALTVHLRTAKEMSEPPAHFEVSEEIVSLKNSISKKTILIANGDIKSKKEGIDTVDKYGYDGVMIGRGIFQNPYFFDENKDWENTSIKDRIAILVRHVELFKKTWGSSKKYDILKKYFKIYIHGFDGASEMRVKFMSTKNYEEVLDLSEYISKRL